MPADHKLGTLQYHVTATVNHRAYTSDSDDVRQHTVELTVNLDKLLTRLVDRACRSKVGKSTGQYGAIVVKRIK